MAAGLRVTGIDHIVLTVRDIEASLRFYCDELGLEGERVEQWRHGEVAFPSVRVNAATIIDLFAGASSGNNLDHFCLVIEPTDFDAVIASGRFDVVDGPGARFGARGTGTSLYVRDPDANVVELRYYD